MPRASSSRPLLRSPRSGGREVRLRSREPESKARTKRGPERLLLALQSLAFSESSSVDAVSVRGAAAQPDGHGAREGAESRPSASVGLLCHNQPFCATFAHVGGRHPIPLLG